MPRNVIVKIEKSFRTLLLQLLEPGSNSSGFCLAISRLRERAGAHVERRNVAGLKLLMGTDAGAGAHGRNAEEIIYRVQMAGQSAASRTSGSAGASS